MQSVFVSGEKTEAYCETCGKFQAATWGYRPHRLDDGTEVEDVMQASCNTCDTAIAVAGQATHRIKGALEEKERHRTRVRLPLELVDLMGHRLNLVSADPTDYEMFLRAVFVAAHEQEEGLGRLLAELTDPVLERPAEAGINVTIGTKVSKLIERLKHETGGSTSDVLRRLLVLSDGVLAPSVDQHLRREAYVAA